MALIDFILHIDDHLITIVNQFGAGSYLILFVIIFIETGLVVFPFLPGDSLIFAAAAMAANNKYNLSIGLIYLAVALAAIIGDSVNYEIGARSVQIGEKYSWFNKLINENNRLAAEKFFERHGSITIVIGRFIPFIRTFVPFISGASKMHYRTFVTFNVLGGLIWTGLFASVGYFFGNIPIVKEHFSLIVLAIILVSVLPILIVMLKKKLTQKKEFH
ncbi:VTT domain-containing protein [Lactobacillus gigeriorum]|uniref:DedA protein n=1 Tax=Lactobacillus gigeriorum DSM 23908 = CRBIP 24.85 TaxID=1423751 RepID=I7LCQ0_9LACO|nr:VTT domain-containing protein [Lactobacillus gigeriorum]KRN14314.1 membrane-associated protein [Lactobacillus gigeriorum DSM 23908 = CRBIP 24.85]CCI86681.1 DedA protein [Lactobacillus gigeriorum DSM 23908 = CRBIP 24.85]